MAWVEIGTQPGAVIGFRDDSPQYGGVIGFNTYANPNAEWAQPNTFHLVDVTQTFGLPADTKSIVLSGIMIITGGSTNETADLTLFVRAYGNTLNAFDGNGNPINYSAQTCAVPPSQPTSRTNFSVSVPINQGKFEFLWFKSTQGTWPTNSAYGITATCQEYKR